MAFDFPASPTEGQTYAPPGGPTYVFHSPVWQAVPATPVAYVATADVRSRVVNGAMQISQENVNAAGTITGYFAADQWQSSFTTTGTITTQRVQSVTPKGSKDRYRLVATVADASLAAGEVCRILQSIEGIRLVDFRYGSASAKQSVLRFGFKAPAGTYAVNLRNSATDRSYVALFTISAGQANTDTEQVIVIPGDTTGTWLIDTGAGIYLAVVLACGTTFQGATGWQAGNFSGTSAVSNGLAVAGAIYELFDVGLYLDPNNTGAPPPWQMPDDAQELLACQRYYEKSYDQAVPAGSTGFAGAPWLLSISTTVRAPQQFKVLKRITAPACTMWSPQTGTAGRIYNGTGAVDVVVTPSNAGDTGFNYQATVAAANQTYYFHWAANARL